MTSFFLRCFVNPERPTIRHDLLERIPDSITGVDATALRESFEVNESDQVACAASARLWEHLLETHGTTFLMLRVADMRFVTGLGSKITAYNLYAEIEKSITNQAYSSWLTRLRNTLTEKIGELLTEFKSGTSFTPSQRWRDSTCHDPFPSSPTSSEPVDCIRDFWVKLKSADADVLSKYLNLHCLQTNHIEGTVEFLPEISWTLVEHGFFHRATTSKIKDSHIKSGSVRDSNDAILVLQDTRRALDSLVELLRSKPVTLKSMVIKRLHKQMMKSSRVLATRAIGQCKIESLNVGVTRQETHVNVAIRTAQLQIQFCPFDSVDAQLEVFCDRFNELMQMPDVDPYAAAAWISHIFVTIHPFEDGNGRLSRILASIPLLLVGLPPVCVGQSSKLAYNGRLNRYRASRSSDFSELIEILQDSSLDAMYKMNVTMSYRVRHGT